MNKPALSKAKLAHAITQQTLLKKQDALDLAEAFFSTLSDALARNQNVKLSGFGQFRPQDKAARPGLNLQTGARIAIAPRRVVTFTPSPKLKEHVACVEEKQIAENLG